MKSKNTRTPKKVLELINKKKSISLDIGCGAFKRYGAIGMDIRPMKGVDIVHDINIYPWPIPDEVCSLTTASHLMEHISKTGLPPQFHSLVELLLKKKIINKKEVNKFIGETQILSFLMRLMDEVWRITKVGGQFALTFPYASSIGFYQDPTHAAPLCENTWFYFDPSHYTKLWTIYKPKPWKVEINAYQVNGNSEVVLSKLPWNKLWDKTI